MPPLDRDEINAAIVKAIDDYYLPDLDDECKDIADDVDPDHPFILLERGHYRTTWASPHASPDDAAGYTLNQECSEDWMATVLIDCNTGDLLEPVSFYWRKVNP